MGRKIEKREGQINIKSKTPLFTRNNLYIFIIIIITAIITGIVTTKYISNKLSNVVGTAINSAQSNVVVDNVIKEVGPSLVTIGSSPSALDKIEINPQNTTGVIISKEGLIITNYNLVKDMQEIYVKLPAKGVKAEKAILLGHDENTGIAVLKINNKNLTPIQISNSVEVKTGIGVVSLGNADNSNYIGMITPGLVTSTNFSIVTDGERDNVIQTDAVMNNQNYGGVLCNSAGQMIGFNSSYLTQKYNEPNLYFAVGNEAILNSVEKILDKSNILGIQGAILDNNGGFYISNVKENSPASKAGLKATDIIVSINGKPIRTLDDFYLSCKELSQGKVATIGILRDGKSKEMNIQLK